MQISIKTKKMLCVAITVLIFLTALDKVQAIGFGTVQKRFSANAMQGESAESTILFWNIEETPVQIAMNVKQTPDNWIVEIIPEEFLLNKSKIGPPYDGEYIGLPGIGDVKALPVKVLVNVPLSATPGTYDVFVTARAGTPDSGIVATQERTFKFTINVTRAPTFFETYGKAISDSLSSMIAGGAKAVSKIAEAVSSLSFDLKIVFLILSVIIILTISWVIYKHE